MLTGFLPALRAFATILQRLQNVYQPSRALARRYLSLPNLYYPSRAIEKH